MTINIHDIPQIETEVGLVGESKQTEVGGPICLSILLSIGLWVTGR